MRATDERLEGKRRCRQKCDWAGQSEAQKQCVFLTRSLPPTSKIVGDTSGTCPSCCSPCISSGRLMNRSRLRPGGAGCGTGRAGATVKIYFDHNSGAATVGTVRRHAAEPCSSVCLVQAAADLARISTLQAGANASPALVPPPCHLRASQQGAAWLPRRRGSRHAGRALHPPTAGAPWRQAAARCSAGCCWAAAHIPAVLPSSWRHQEAFAALASWP